MLLHIFVAFAFLVGCIFNTPIPNRVDNEINYELLGGGFEGDMILPDGFDPSKESDEKGVAISGNRRWPKNVIPYDISLITDAADHTMIQEAMRILTSVTGTPIAGTTARKPCVTLRTKTASDPVFVKIQYGTGCSASVGYSTGTKTLTLQNSGCFRSGFHHEQSRPDRDSYVTVNYANIQQGKEHNFNKYVWDTSVFNQNTPYDFGSFMHYGGNSFSSNGQPIITTKQSGVTIGQRDKLSATDIDEIRAYYSCLS